MTGRVKVPDLDVSSLRWSNQLRAISVENAARASEPDVMNDGRTRWTARWA